MDGGLDPFDPCTDTIGFGSSSEDDDDPLRFLQFSDPDFPLPAALPAPPIDGIEPELLDAVHEPSFWDIGDPPTNKATLAVSQEDGNHRPSLLNACETPAAAADDIRATPSQLDCSGCHILREVVHTNKATLAISQEDGNHRPSSSNAYETPAAVAADDIRAMPSQLDCSGCHILREVVHTNGLQNIKLTIHGGLGVFYHATVGVYDSIHGFPLAMEEAYIDLSTQTFEQVKQFLVDYGLLRMRDRYVVIEDSLSNFYDVLCVKLSNDIASTSTATPRLPEPGLCQSRPTEENDMDVIRIPKTGIAAQRERTGKLHVRDLSQYFHLPITEAAKELKICSTAIKKICRRHGMSRWPYRKIKGIDRMISSLVEETRTKTGQEVTQTLAEIEKLRVKRARVCAGFLS